MGQVVYGVILRIETISGILMVGCVAKEQGSDRD